MRQSVTFSIPICMLFNMFPSVTFCKFYGFFTFSHHTSKSFYTFFFFNQPSFLHSFPCFLHVSISPLFQFPCFNRVITEKFTVLLSCFEYVIYVCTSFICFTQEIKSFYKVDIPSNLDNDLHFLTCYSNCRRN